MDRLHQSTTPAERRPSALAPALLASLGGLLALALLRPEWLNGLIDSFAGSQPKAFWYLSRSSGLAAYALLWGSMALGLAITNRMARIWPGGPTVAALHEYVSLLGLALTVVHAAALLGDTYANYTLGQILLPFAGDYRPWWVGLGQVGFYLLVPLTFSFYARRWIGHRLWRRLHYLSFAVFAMALAHGLYSGSDSGVGAVRLLYGSSAISLAGLLAYRIARTVASGAPQIQAPSKTVGDQPADEWRANAAPADPRRVATQPITRPLD